MKGRLLRRGKVKDIYEIGDSLLFVFSDRVSAFDVILPSLIPHKGEILCRFSEFWFNRLSMPNHMIEVREKNKMVVKKLKMIPIECVVRGYVYGSFYERLLRGKGPLDIKSELAAKISEPIFDPTTKSMEKDLPISKSEILSKGLLKEEELSFIEKKSVELYKKMAKRCEEAGFIMADVKFEFGKDGDEIILADSIGPDEFRLWPKEKYALGKPQESYDKQLVRDWLISVGFKRELDEAIKKGRPLPEPPTLPDELIEETTRRYVSAFERITGLNFR
ncbi:MAG: phosphoribosylaminoimidazolesuccinocarboxamide synthase [archaeon]|nr:phosphoribosylaminoimidazolesuccinocarboxamide synthase [archaeon]MCP8305546.1 phosphoribosylaminoimidazolesuccinocarboxamide synthase [archaeon]